MIGTVVVPLDGSELAERALGYATGIADRMNAPILLVGVVPVASDESEKNETRAYLRSVEKRLDGRVQIAVERGRPAEAITEVARLSAESLIVMSTHGRGGIHRWMVGSVAEEVVRTAGMPVLLVRGDKEVPRELMVANILAPVDGSEYAEAALDYAVELARAFGATIHLLRVVDTPSAYAMLSRHMETAATGDILDEIIKSMREETDDYLEKLAQQVASRGVSVRTVSLEGYPGEKLIEHERQGFFQLVVMATAGRSGVSRVVFGSVAERVLKLGRSPVILIRPTDTNGSRSS
jgi:nucleotide-binding universal stress UspA family protein